MFGNLFGQGNQQQPNMNNMFGNLFQQQAPPQQTVEQLRATYGTQLASIRAMGFYDDAATLRALQRANGDVSRAVEFLLQG